MNLLYSIYFIMPNFARIGQIGKVINRILALIFKKIFDLIVPIYFKRTASKGGYGINTEYRSQEIIVSLTSFPARIDNIWITIETLFRQSLKPDKIILWLAENQFPNKVLPKSLDRMKDRGLRIEYCDDIKSHNKYYYSMNKYPNAIIITVDDDVYYERNILRNLLELHYKYPKCIAANRAHKITFESLNIKPYGKWKHNVSDETPSHYLVPTGHAGTLYPPGLLHNEVFSKDLLKRLCLKADDLWLKIMALKNNTMAVTNGKYNKDFISVKSSQRKKLVSMNVLNGGNDQQLTNIINYFNLDILTLIRQYDQKAQSKDFAQ